MAEAWRSAPLATETPPPQGVPTSEFVETPGGAATARAPRRRPASPAQDVVDQAWRSAPVVEPSLGEKAGAFAKSAVGGFVEAGSIAAGTLAGGSVGSLTGTPVGVAAFASVGAGAGLEAGKRGRRALETSGLAADPKDLPPELRPYAYAGEVIGASGPIAAVPVQLGLKGARSGIGYVDRLLEFAGRAPNSFLAAEASRATAAGVAGGVAEAYLPDNTGARIGAEVAGGFFNPSAVAIGAARGAVDSVKRAVGTMTQAGRESSAARAIQDIVTQSGEDPVALAKALREANLPGLAVTAAQKTGSPALIALEAKLAKESAQKFGAPSRKMAEDSLNAIQDMIRALRGTGDPMALRTAAELQERHFRAVITGRIQLAEQSAVEAASRITRDSPQTRALLSRQANELVDQALRDVRAVETELWEKVPKDMTANAESIIQRFAKIRNELLPEERMPEIVEGFVKRVGQGTTSGELMRFRSRALALAREAGAQGKANDARIFGSLAEAALDDLDALTRNVDNANATLSELSAAVFGRKAVDLPNDMKALTEARAFSRQLNETFTQTFAGESLATRATGADRIPPELVLRRALGAGRELGELRLRELEEALRFLPSRNLGGPEAQRNLDIMLDAQQRVLRLAAAESIDPTTSRVSVTRLSRFLDTHAGLLERFPEVRTTLRQAVRSETSAQEIRQIAEGAARIVERQAAFSRVLKTDSASDAVRKALGGDRPESEIVALARLAKGRGGGSEAVEGFKAAVWDDAVRRSADASGNLSFEKLYANLFSELRPGLPPLANVLQREGVLSAADISKAQEFIKQAQTIQSALQKGTSIETLMQNPDALFDLVLRVAGAKLGSAMNSAGPGGGGSSLIAASRGSSFARQVFDKVPQGRVKDVMIQAALDPKFMALLLEKPKTPTEGIRLARQIHAYIIQAGLTGPSDE